MGNLMFDLVATCYSGETLQDMLDADNGAESWANTKGSSGDKLQLGWLDRGCWKASGRRQLKNHRIVENKDFAKRWWVTASRGTTDHMPTLAEFTIFDDEVAFPRA